MGKENEEIHVHIIEEDYRSSKRKQEQQFEATGMTDITAELMQKNVSALQKLQNMHSGFLTGLEEAQTKEEQHADTEFEEHLNSCSTPELFSSFQDMKNRENNLLNKKQNLMEKAEELRGALIHEIATKRRSIRRLESDVIEFQNTCKEIEQALGINAPGE